MFYSMKRILIFFALTSFIVSCKNSNVREDGYSVTADKLYYKLCKIGEGELHPENGDLVLLSVCYRTQKDSVFFNSRQNAWLGYFIPVKKDADPMCFSSYLSSMNEGDSMCFMVRAGSFFKDIFNSNIPEFIGNDSIVKAEVKLIAVMDSSEMNLYKSGRITELKEKLLNEPEVLLNYAKSNWKEYDSIPESIYFKKTRFTKDTAITEGKLVSLRYTGYFLDGRIFDNAQSSKTFDFTYGSQEQLLPGLQTALAVMRRGEIAKIIVPSQLAYGELGSGNIVPPFEPLLFEIEIVDVK